MVGCFREEDGEVVMKLEEMVEVARVELAYFISVYTDFKLLHVTMHVIRSAD